MISEFNLQIFSFYKYLLFSFFQSTVNCCFYVLGVLPCMSCRFGFSCLETRSVRIQWSKMCLNYFHHECYLLDSLYEHLNTFLWSLKSWIATETENKQMGVNNYFSHRNEFYSSAPIAVNFRMKSNLLVIKIHFWFTNSNHISCWYQHVKSLTVPSSVLTINHKP